MLRSSGYFSFAGLFRQKETDSHGSCVLRSIAESLSNETCDCEELKRKLELDIKIQEAEVKELVRELKFYESQLGETVYVKKCAPNKVEALEPAGETKKQPKVNKSEKKVRGIDISRMSLLVGRIVEVSKHPDADKLFIEKVHFGNEVYKTVISGLVGKIPAEELNQRLALFMTNLKPVRMRGIASESMIMCASTPEKVEILTLPKGCREGDRVSVDGFFQEPDKVMNPKEKIIEQLLPLFKVDNEGTAKCDGKALIFERREVKGYITAATLRDCNIK